MMVKTILLVAMGMFAATAASAQAVGSQTWVPDLSGTYRCVQYCKGAQLIHIVQHFRQMDITSGNQTANASIGWSGHISTSWNDDGVYSPDGTTIQFTNGTVWVLVDPTPIPGRTWNE